MFFYICFYSLALYPAKNLFKIYCILLILIICAATYSFFDLKGQITLESKNLIHWLFYIFPGFRLIEFICGMLLYKCWKTGLRLNSNLILPSYITILFAMYYAECIPQTFRLSLWYLPFIAFFFYTHLTQTVFSCFFSSKILILLGNASFAFYMIHLPLIKIFEILLAPFKLSNLFFILIVLLLTSLLSVLIYLVYEKKAESFLKSCVNKKT